ncbi:hypothetical protein [Candidatus Nitrosacidococcus tergens]|uniref:Uncharacterized protein n=1 Tax=Candidatus Nitrosacidococcus tergens TaxID=553981 RepID=A0A7G1Q7R3_9GAMM|nr:hypothetical protein [Candidatus Nitrosacidococcus tergens]CAB1274225.1 conserved protein of unknown function [Candidatus Nitrosacidococcus tergens]
MPSLNQQIKSYIALEAARLMVEHGIQSYYHAKTKAAAILKVSDHRNLPTNLEIAQATQSYLGIFKFEMQAKTLREKYQATLRIMDFFSAFNPRLTGDILQGIVSKYSDIYIHVFADSENDIALFLTESYIDFKLESKTFSFTTGESKSFPVFQIIIKNLIIKLVVFPTLGIRFSPLSPIDKKPMKRAKYKEVERLFKSYTQK